MSYLIHLSPESIFHDLLCSLQCLAVLERVQMRENSHDSWETMDLADVQKFKYFHFETEGCIHHDEGKVGDLCHIDHGIDIIGALDESQTLPFSCDDRHWTLHVIQSLFREVPNQALE